MEGVTNNNNNNNGMGNFFYIGRGGYSPLKNIEKTKKVKNGYAIIERKNKALSTCEDEKCTREEEDEAGLHMTFVGVCFIHCVLLIIVVGLVSVIFSRDPSHALVLMEGYNLIPGSDDGGCQVWVNGECVEAMNYEFNHHHHTTTTSDNNNNDNSNNNNNNNNNNNMEMLKGDMKMTEGKAMGLFSSVNSVVVCLVVQVISTVFHLALVPVSNVNSKWALQRFSFIIFVIFAILLLLMRTTWIIPSNIMLWLETLLVASMFTLGSRHKYASWWDTQGKKSADTPHILSAAFTLPALGIVVLAVAGEDNTEGLVFVYFGLLGAILFRLLEVVSLNNEPQSGGALQGRHEEVVFNGGGFNNKAHHVFFVSEPRFVARLNMWLCLIPFIALVSLRFDAIANLPTELTPTHWSVGALIFALVWFLCYALYFTFYSCDGGGVVTGIYCMILHQVLHSSLVLLILIGFIVSTS